MKRIMNYLSKMKYNRGDAAIFLIIIIVLFAFVLVSIVGNPITNPNQYFTPGTPDKNIGYISHTSEQLHTLPFDTLTPVPTDFTFPSEPPFTPPPGVYCNRESPKNGCQCVPTEKDYLVCVLPSNTCSGGARPACPYNGNLLCVRPKITTPACVYDSRSNPSGVAARQNDPTCTHWCIGKPVIYLYPRIPTIVNVLLTIPGSITQSIPTYPGGGWQNILALPGGEMFYKGSKFSELYYESAVNTVHAPDNGIVISTKNLQPSLLRLIKQLGLIPHEQDEFMAYWMPRLRQLNKPYVMVSLISAQEKERIDHVAITPKPQTMIAFLVYFKGLDLPITLKPLKFPAVPPVRLGFTAVEWGGVIDPSSD